MNKQDDGLDEYGNEDSGSITISKQKYERLIESKKLLQALQNAGVDNWEGYDSALESFFKELKGG